MMGVLSYQVPSEITIGVQKAAGRGGGGAKGGRDGSSGQCRMAKSICIDWQKVHFAKEDEVEGD